MKLLPIKRVVAMIYCTVCSICVFTPWIASVDCSNAPPQRIVVFPLYAEEIIYGLVEPERIIYVGHHYAESGIDDWPTMIKSQQAAGECWENSDEEEILSLNPDLLILDSYLQDNFEEDFPAFFHSTVPTLFLDSPKSIDDIIHLIILLGDIVQKPDAALSMVNEMISSMSSIREVANKIPTNEKKTVALFGEPSIFFDLVANVCNVNGLYCPDEQSLAVANPDIIVLLPYCMDGGFLLDIGKEYSKDCIVQLESESSLSRITAISSGAIYALNFHGSQYIADCAMRLLKIAYPTFFSD